MATALDEQRPARVERLDERDAVDATPASFTDARAVEGHDEDRTVKAARQFARHDADHAGMPGLGAQHERRAIRPGQQSARGEQCLGLHLRLHVLAVAILAVELPRQSQRLRVILGRQEVECRLRGVEPAGCVETRTEPVAEMHGARPAVDAAHFFEGAEAGVARGGEAFEPFGDEQAVFADERHHVGHGPQCDEIEHVFEQRALCGLPARLEQGVREFEREARRAEIMRVRPELGVDHDGVGQSLG